MGFIADAVSQIPVIGGVAQWAVDPIGAAANKATGVSPIKTATGLATGNMPGNNGFQAVAPNNGFHIATPTATPAVSSAAPASGGFLPPNVANALGMGMNIGAGAPVGSTAAAMPVNNFTPGSFTATTPVNPYQAQTANLAQSDYGSIIGGLGGQAAGMGGPAAGTIGQQGQLAQALAAQANGQGPSLANEQLKQATQQNAAQAAGMIGSQRGINPATAQRSILNATGAINQQAAGQSALTRLQEQMAARAMQGNVLAQQGGLQLGQQSAGTQALGTAGGLQNAQNAANIQNLGMAQGINAQTAGQNAALNLGTQQLNANQFGLAQQLAQQTAAQNASLWGQSNQINAQAAMQNAALGLGAQQINASTAQANAANSANLTGGLLGGIGAVGAALLNRGGEVPAYAAGGSVNPWASAGNGLGALLGKILGHRHSTQGDYSPALPESPLETAQSFGAPTLAPWEGAPSLLTTGIPYSNGSDLSAGGADYSSIPYAAHGGTIDFRSGGGVPGKPKVKGDSPRNDTVPAMVSPGEVVLPRSVAQAPDAPERAARFVEAIQARHAPAEGYGRVLATGRGIEERIRRLEALAYGGKVGC